MFLMTDESTLECTDIKIFPNVLLQLLLTTFSKNVMYYFDDDVTRVILIR